MPAFIAPLPSRAVVRIGGEQAASFLQGLVTCNVDDLPEGEARFGALLTPQGKILFDFLIQHRDGGFLVDLAAPLAGDFVKRMMLYKLRAKVEIADLSESHRILAVWSDAGAPAKPEGAFADPRHAGLGFRLIAERAAPLPEGYETAEEADWQAHRIALGVPEGGLDFEYGQAFPHDTDMDALKGVAFDKGCFIGQEVVSRMRHRGTARRRIVAVTGPGPLPAAGTEILAAGKAAGTLGSSASGHGLALVRIDRIGAALKAGAAIEADGVALLPKIPAWANFDWPADASDGEAGA